MLLSQLLLFHREPVEQLAVAHLVHPDAFRGLPKLPGPIRVKLVRVPSFEPYSVWALALGERGCQVRRIEWNRANTLSPALGSQAGLPTDIAEELLEELTAIRLPAMVKAGALGLDGISYGVVIGDHYTSMEFSWWARPPEEWNELAVWYEKALGIFEDVLPASSLRAHA